MNVRRFGWPAALLGALCVVAPALAQTPPASPSVNATPTSTAPAFTVSDAPAVRDDLLAIGLANLDELARPGFEGFFQAWRAKYPALEGDGYAIASVPGSVSIWWNRLQPKSAASDSNPEAIAIAVADTQGRCAGGVLYGNPKIDKSARVTVTASGAAACTARQVVDDFGATLRGTPVASPSPGSPVSTAAPQPPATGSGLGRGEDYRWLALAGAVLFSAGLILLSSSRARH